MSLQVEGAKGQMRCKRIIVIISASIATKLVPNLSVLSLNGMVQKKVTDSYKYRSLAHGTVSCRFCE